MRSRRAATDAVDPNEDPAETTRRAVDDAVRVLARRSHGRRELQVKLQRRGYPGTIIDAAFERLAELNYLEQEDAVAQRYAEELARKKGATPRLTEQKLRQRGFSESDTERAVGHAFRDWDARVAALDTVEGVEDPAKAARRLTRKGFPADAVAWVVERLRR